MTLESWSTIFAESVIQPVDDPLGQGLIFFKVLTLNFERLTFKSPLGRDQSSDC